MSKHLPPIPEAAVSPAGPGGPDHLDPSQAKTSTLKRRRLERNLALEGHQGNIKQNTTNKGLQQDR